MNKFNKKGQEEIAGFVAIVVIVTIIGLIFLGLSLSNQPIIKESKDENRLLEGMLGYTTDCAFYEPNYRIVEDLTKDCYENPSKLCLDGKTSCQELNDTLWGLIDSAYPIGDQYVRKGFIFNATYSDNINSSSSYKEVLEIQKGNCTSNVFVGADMPFATADGSITTSIEVCY